jgi:hypothetical protein
MNKEIIPDIDNFENIISKINKDSFSNLHILADFDRTLTKAFSS